MGERGGGGRGRGRGVPQSFKNKFSFNYKKGMIQNRRTLTYFI